MWCGSSMAASSLDKSATPLLLLFVNQLAIRLGYESLQLLLLLMMIMMNRSMVSGQAKNGNLIRNPSIDLPLHFLSIFSTVLRLIHGCSASVTAAITTSITAVTVT